MTNSNLHSSNSYDVYANTVCSEIPIETLKGFIMSFLIDASQDMGSEFDKTSMPERVHYIISTHYNHLPLMLIASAFKRGALGQYGAGRLVPRTVFGWLGEMNQYFTTQHEVRDASKDKQYKYDGLEKYPLGKAICKKIDWLDSGAITSDEWDLIPLKELSERIKQGLENYPELFGINHKK
jgi:hypothetical protein